MSALDAKLWRDLKRLSAQGLAIALVMACGVATLILAFGAQNSLEEIRATYYDRYIFADVFAELTRAPNIIGKSILEIDGVSAVETRISKFALLDLDGMPEPATGRSAAIEGRRASTRRSSPSWSGNMASTSRCSNASAP